jgi:hypothetical protein
MSTMTYYVALPFIRTDEGTLVPGEGVEAQNEHQAKSKARAMAATAAGAIAFSRKGDPDLGNYEPAEIIARYGETPDELD